MALPATLVVKINLSGGASFGNPFILGTSQLGFAELASSVPVIVDVSAQTLNISTRRGRNLIQDQYESGQATIRINDPDGDWNPQNTSSPYYGLLQPLRKIQASAIYGATTYGLFGGYITEYRYTYPTGQETGYVTFICYDAFRLMYNSNVTTVTGGTAGQTTAQRVQSILTMIAWPPAFTSIGTGATTCVVDPGTTRTVLEAIQTAEFTEQGAFYIDENGVATFKGRQFVYDAQAASPTVFNQTGGISYAGITFALDDKTIVNKATVTRIGGTAGQTTAQRVQSILTMIAWPPAFTSIGTGATTCVADPGTTRTVLEAIQTAEFTEQGAFYIDENGVATFKGRQYVYDAQAASPTVFNQTGTGINYAGITFALDDKTIVNKASVTRIGGTTQTYSDATSIAQYFTRSITATDMLMQTDANALALATAYVDSRKETSIRIETITLDLMTPSYTAGVTAALSLDFFNTVDITNEQPGGSTIQKKLQVQGIAHNITPNTWTTTIATQEPLLDVMYQN